MMATPESSTGNDLQTAHSLLEQGLLDEARQIYLSVLAVQPRHDGCLSMLGQIEVRRQCYEAALAFFERAIECRSTPEYLTARGNALHLLQRHADAVASFDQALALDPGMFETWLHRGDALLALERFAEAVLSFGKAIAVNPESLGAYCNRGVAYEKLLDLDKALADYDRAAALSPDVALFHCNRGSILLRQERLDAAIAAFDRAIALEPHNVRAYQHRGAAYERAFAPGKALPDYDQVVKHAPDSPFGHMGRGTSLLNLGHLEAAAAAFDRVIAIDPSNAGAYGNRGLARRKMGLESLAVEDFNTALSLDGNSPSAHYNLGISLLRAGEYPEGWRLYEWRSRQPWKNPSRFAQPLWLGDSDISGKTILLHGEQGLGDMIQFCRYAGLVKRHGARVILEVPHPLVRVVQTLAGVDLIVAAGEALPHFDVQCPLMSLPLACGTTLETVPGSVPYLLPDASLVQQWQPRLDQSGALRVGIVWNGANKLHRPDLQLANEQRNITLDEFSRIKQPGIAFYSLQKGAPAEPELERRRAQVWPEDNLFVMTNELHDFADTAALIACLDLVVAVDTSTAHLAGAMGKPVWLLNRFDTCWRWMLERDDSPWYPTMKIYRQTTPGDWEDVVNRVSADLRQLASRH